MNRHQDLVRALLAASDDPARYEKVYETNHRFKTVLDLLIRWILPSMLRGLADDAEEGAAQDRAVIDMVTRNPPPPFTAPEIPLPPRRGLDYTHHPSRWTDRPNLPYDYPGFE